MLSSGRVCLFGAVAEAAAAGMGVRAAAAAVRARSGVVDRAQKEEFVDAINRVFSETAIVVVTHNTGLSVAEITALRSQVRAVGGTLKVTKNRLVKRAIVGTPFEPLTSLFTGPTTIAYADDVVAVAKVVADFAKSNERLVLLGGGLGSMVLDSEGVKTLAKMPPIEEMRAKLLGVFKAPMANALGVLNAPAQKMVGVLHAPPRKLVGVLHAKAA